MLEYIANNSPLVKNMTPEEAKKSQVGKDPVGAIGIRMMMLGERLYANEASKNQSGAFDNWVRPYKKMEVKMPMTKRIEIFCSAQEKWLNIYVGIEEKWRKVRLWLFVFSGVAGLAFLYQTLVVYYPFYLTTCA